MAAIVLLGSAFIHKSSKRISPVTWVSCLYIHDHYQCYTDSLTANLTNIIPMDGPRQHTNEAAIIRKKKVTVPPET